MQLLRCCRYTGSLYVAAAGNYTFQLDTIQGAQLWVNDQLLIDQAGKLSVLLHEHAVKQAVQGFASVHARQGCDGTAQGDGFLLAAGGHTEAGVGQGSYSVNEPGYIAVGVNYNTDLTAAQSVS